MDNIAEELINYFIYDLKNHYHSSTIRKTQIEMALGVLSFLLPENPRKYLFIEAPVGTGKSFGALIPLMIFQKNVNPVQILYATSTINLQGQLNKGELPTLQKFNLLNRYIYAKGKAHYFCNKMFIFHLDDPILEKHKNEFKQFYAVSETGHRDEFEERYFSIHDQLWRLISLQANPSGCLDCSFNECPTARHRNQFRLTENDLILTNHDQLIRSVLNYNEGFSPIVQINPGVILIDEGHDFLENFLGQLEKSFSINELESITNKIPDKFRTQYQEIIVRLKTILRKEIIEKESFSGRYPISNFACILLNKLKNILSQSLISLQAQKMSQNPVKKTDKGRIIEDIYENIRAVLDSKYEKWIDYEEGKFSAVIKTFINEFKDLTKILSSQNKIIVMSGTLTDNKDFANMINQWGLNKNDVQTLIIRNSFSFKDQARIYVPPKKQLTSFNKKGYSDDYLKNQSVHIKSVLDITGGRSLILVTSKKYLDSLYENLLSYAKEKNILLLKQGMASVDQLSKEFETNETSVLIGTKSFFSGISIKGKSLISVIITKLPFAVKDDPYLKLIGTNFNPSEFREKIVFPDMMIKLKQQVGRLIRDIKDFGVITILDSRFLGEYEGKKMSQYFVDQGYIITQEINDIKAFLNNCMKNGLEIDYPLFNRESLIIPKSLEKIVPRHNVTQISEVTTKKRKPSRRKNSSCRSFKLNDLPEEEQLRYQKMFNER